MNLRHLRTATLAVVAVTFGVVATTASARSTAPRVATKHVVEMISTDDKKELYAPVDITIQVGDTVSWLAVSGSHNVAFWADSIPPGAEARLLELMPDQTSPLNGARRPKKGSTYDIVFTDVPKGVYKYFCKPHLRKGMVGTITVK